MFKWLVMLGVVFSAHAADPFAKPTPWTVCGQAGWGYVLVGDRSELRYLSGDAARGKRVDGRGWWVTCGGSCRVPVQYPKWSDGGVVCTASRRLAGIFDEGASVSIPASPGESIGAVTYVCRGGEMVRVYSWCASTRR